MFSQAQRRYGGIEAEARESLDSPRGRLNSDPDGRIFVPNEWWELEQQESVPSCCANTVQESIPSSIASGSAARDWSLREILEFGKYSKSALHCYE